MKSLSMREALLFTFVLSLLSGVLFGMIPVLRYAGSWTPAALQSAGRTASFSRERNHARNLLVVAQVAMALVLLVSAGLMIRTFQELRNIDPGFADAQHLQTMRISIPDSLVANPQMVTRIQNNIVDKLAAIPGVTFGRVRERHAHGRHSKPAGTRSLPRERPMQAKLRRSGSSITFRPAFSARREQGSSPDASLRGPRSTTVSPSSLSRRISPANCGAARPRRSASEFADGSEHAVASR